MKSAHSLINEITIGYAKYCQARLILHCSRGILSPDACLRSLELGHSPAQSCEIRQAAHMTHFELRHWNSLASAISAEIATARCHHWFHFLFRKT